MTVSQAIFLKVRVPFLAGSLSQPLDMSMSLGPFPDDWKIARVAHIYKDGSEDKKFKLSPYVCFTGHLSPFWKTGA